MDPESQVGTVCPFLVDALKADPELLDLAYAARQRGVTVRAMLGWRPSYDVQAIPEGGWRIVQSEPEWDGTERALALAVDLIEAQTCKQCGGDLAVELTDKPPHEDDGDGHYHKGRELWCRKCVARSRMTRQLEVSDEDLHGTPADTFPEARFLALERLPIPDEMR